ncbi:MAG: T9SS type A sorting domain-containing protein [Bacteroidia bacterium]|nr:T9SS type A sorting domain-containing protein [Bacteroidia bacterium]
MKHIVFLTLSLIFQAPFFVGAQKLALHNEATVNTIQSNGFTLNWQLNQKANAWVEWSATHTNQTGTMQLGEQQENFRWIFREGEPARFYQVTFFAANQNDTLKSGPFLYTTRALSTGEIKVYFNHEVEHAVATQTPANYLNKLVDDTLIAYLNRAKQTIDIAIYNSSTANSLSNIAAALNSARTRGVQVRMVYDESSSNTMIPNVSSQIGKIKSKVRNFTYGLMHNKFVVIDADAENPNDALVWTGSTNWTVDQLNGPDENNVIILQDQALARAYKLEFEEMFGSTGPQPNEANAKFGPDKTNNTPHEFNIGGRRVRSYFSPSDGANAQIIGVINSAGYDLEFASMVITRFDIANAITNRVSNGLTETYGVIDDSTQVDQVAEWNQLKGALRFGRMTSNNGFAGIMHHKFVIADATAPGSDPQVLTGSHNWSTSAETKNDENTLIIHDADIANQYYQAFSWLFKRYTGRTVGISPMALPQTLWQVFPNPAASSIQLKRTDNSNSQQVQVRLSDLGGQTIRQLSGTGSTHSIQVDVAELNAGIYLLEVVTGQERAVFRVAVAR